MNANHRQKENRLAGNETAQMKTGGLSLTSIADGPTVHTTRAIDSYFETAYMWTYRNLDEIREPQAEIPFEDCETIARALMATPAIFWDCQPHPLELTGQIKNDITLYVASAIRQANRSLQATAEANHRAFHATVQAHLKDPRSYAEIEQARRVA